MRNAERVGDEMKHFLSLLWLSAVFLSGVPQHCDLSFMTGPGTTIPEGASVRVVLSSDITVEFPHAPCEVAVGREGGVTVHQFTLPAVGPESSCDCHMVLTVPAVKHVRTTLAETQDTTEQLSAWKHEVSDVLIQTQGSISGKIFEWLDCCRTSVSISLSLSLSLCVCVCVCSLRCTVTG